MNLRAHYEASLEQHGFSPDPAQLEAVAALETVRDGLCAGRRGAGILSRVPLLDRFAAPPEPVIGLYMWGGVGRGKTFIMDVFFESLPFDDKLRYHFHRLMYRVHNQLHELKGETDPIDIVAADLAKQARVICFDEFFVSEIGDAMLLGNLLKGLFRRGVTLIATSNIPPDELYKDGLQRQQFLPAIELLKQKARALELDNGQDYRLRVLTQAEIWHAPLDPVANSNLQSYFTAIAPDTGTVGQSMEILGREIQTQRRADGIAWFSFKELCDGPRSQNDYIEIARAFQTVILSDIPEMTTEHENQARRFIALVDEFYDRRVKLIASAARPVEAIYSGKRLVMEFQRTHSRLLEMQSTEYLAAQHLA